MNNKTLQENAGYTKKPASIQRTISRGIRPMFSQSSASPVSPSGKSGVSIAEEGVSADVNDG